MPDRHAVHQENFIIFHFIFINFFDMIATCKQVVFMNIEKLREESVKYMYDLTEDTPIKLGTDWGNATFRIFMCFCTS